MVLFRRCTVRRATVILGVLVAVATLAPTALADPKTEPIYLDCVGVPSGFIASNGNGDYTAGLSLSSTGVYIPYEFAIEGYFTPVGGEEYLLFSDSTSKKKPPNNANSHPHGVCFFEQTMAFVDDPYLGTGTGRFIGSALVFYTGK